VLQQAAAATAATVSAQPPKHMIISPDKDSHDLVYQGG
jgi:hypothetical protein